MTMEMARLDKKGGHWRPPLIWTVLGRRKADPTDENDAPEGLTKP
jgi:hypothetical protein